MYRQVPAAGVPVAFIAGRAIGPTGGHSDPRRRTDFGSRCHCCNAMAFSMGVAEDPGHRDKPYYIPRERVEQANRMIQEGRRKGIEFVLPVDFVLANGRVRISPHMSDVTKFIWALIVGLLIRLYTAFVALNLWNWFAVEAFHASTISFF